MFSVFPSTGSSTTNFLSDRNPTNTWNFTPGTPTIGQNVFGNQNTGTFGNQTSVFGQQQNSGFFNQPSNVTTNNIFTQPASNVFAQNTAPFTQNTNVFGQQGTNFFGQFGNTQHSFFDAPKVQHPFNSTNTFTFNQPTPPRKSKKVIKMPAYHPVNAFGVTLHSVTMIKEYNKLSFEEIAWLGKSGVIQVQPPVRQQWSQPNFFERFNAIPVNVRPEPLRFPFEQSQKSIAGNVTSSPYGSTLPSPPQKIDIEKKRLLRKPVHTPKISSPKKRKNVQRFSEDEIDELQESVSSPSKAIRLLSPSSDSYCSPLSPVDEEPIAGDSKVTTPTLLPKLEREGYFINYVKPQVEDPSQLDNHDLMCIDIVVGNEHGEILFAGVNVVGLNLDEIVDISHGSVDIYPDRTAKPHRGMGLNVPGTVTLRNISPPSPDKAQIFEQWLKLQNKLTGSEFISYRAEKSEWRFRI